MAARDFALRVSLARAFFLPTLPLGAASAAILAAAAVDTAITAGVALLKATGTDACAVLIPGAEARYVAVGDRAGIAKVLEIAAPQAGEGKVEVPVYELKDGIHKFTELAISELFTGPKEKATRSDLRNLAREFNPAFWQVEKVASSPPAPVAEEGQTAATGEGQQQDEQAAFEAWYEPMFGKQMRLGDSGQYDLQSTQGAWQAWQARASLSSPAERQEAEALICPDCGKDRLKEPRPRMADECAMVADTHLLPPTPSAPSGEIGTVDTPELAHFLCTLFTAPSGKPTADAREALIAHIDQHTAQAVKAAREEVRNAVLEEAAMICDWQSYDAECPERATYCAEAIRALRTPQPSVEQGEK